MNRLLARLALVAIITVVGAGVARATSFTPTPIDLWDLDHGYAYSWRIDGQSLGANEVSAASLSFTNIRNWDNNANRLFIWMYDTAIGSGARRTWDGESNPPSDYFAGSPAGLIASGTSGHKLTDLSFTSTTVPLWTYTFDSDDLLALDAYLRNGGNVAFGFDPDCHYYNSGVRFTLETQPVPEPASLALLGLGLVGVARASRRRR